MSIINITKALSPIRETVRVQDLEPGETFIDDYVGAAPSVRMITEHRTALLNHISSVVVASNGTAGKPGESYPVPVDREVRRVTLSGTWMFEA